VGTVAARQYEDEACGGVGLGLAVAQREDPKRFWPKNVLPTERGGDRSAGIHFLSIQWLSEKPEFKRGGGHSTAKTGFVLFPNHGSCQKTTAERRIKGFSANRTARVRGNDFCRRVPEDRKRPCFRPASEGGGSRTFDQAGLQNFAERAGLRFPQGPGGESRWPGPDSSKMSQRSWPGLLTDPANSRKRQPQDQRA